MQTANTELRNLSGITSAPATFRSVQHRVERANAEFESADNVLHVFAPVLTRLSWMPKFGVELAAAPDAARTASQVTAGIDSLLSGVQPVIEPSAGTRDAPHVTLAKAASLLKSGEPQFARACALLHAARTTRLHMRGTAGSPSLTSALRTLDRDLPRLLVACQALDVGADLLGAPHPHTYFVAYQDSEELRSTGGFIGSFAFMTLNQGKVSEHFQGTGIHDNLSVPPPEPVQLYNGEPGWLLRDSNWSPDFPSSAALERFFVKLDLHRKVGSVVNVTPAAIADILQATGPIYLPEYHLSVTAANLQPLIDYYTRRAASPGPFRYSSQDTERKQFIDVLGRYLLTRVSALPPSGWMRLGQSLSEAVSHGDLLLNFTNPREQALARTIGAAGAMNTASADFLYVVDTNLSYNKLNPYVHMSMAYRAFVRPDRWIQAHLTLRLTDGPLPATALYDGIGPGAGRLGGPGDYASFMRIYVPAGAALLKQSGWTEPWVPQPAYGRTMFSGYIIVRAHQTRTISIDYQVPPNIFDWSHGLRYRLTVPHQPGSHPDRLDVQLIAGTRTMSWHVAHPSTTWRQTVSIPFKPFSPIPLLRPVPVVVAPGHWIEPYAYLAAPKS